MKVAIICFAVVAAASDSSVDMARPILSCPKGYAVNGKTCLKIEYADVIISCPKNSKLDDGSFLGIFEDDHDNSSAAGENRGAPARPVCVSFRDVPMAVTCPEGYWPSKDKKCERVTKFPAALDCEDKYTLTGGECVRKQIYDVTLQCNKGAKLAGEECLTVVKSPLLPRCAEGLELIVEKDHAVCTRTETVASFSRCPAGYTNTRDGTDTCVKIDRHPVSAECPRGYKEENRVCVRTIELGKPEAVCPLGSSFDGKKCRLVEHSPARANCSAGFRLSANGNVCIKEHEAIPDMVCGKGWKLNRSLLGPTCERVVTTDAVLTCPLGTELSKKNDKCLRAEFEDPIGNCKRGYEIEASGRCVKFSTKEATAVCPPHFELRNNSCILTQKLPVHQMCPRDTVRSPHGNTCLKEEVSRPKATCKKGRLQSDGFTCMEHLIQPPKESCPKGFTLSDRLCVNVDEVNVDRVCPRGFLNADKCEVGSPVEPVRSCLKGFVVGISGKCQRAHATDARPECPPRFRLQGGYCQPVRD